MCYNISMEQILKYNSDEVIVYYERTKQPRSTDFYSSHIHNNYELLYFYDGDVDFIINGSIYHLQKNEMLVIKPAVYHHVRVLSARPYERIVFNFHESALQKELIPIARSMNIFYRVEQNSPLKHIFDYIRDCSPNFSHDELTYLARSALNTIFMNMRYLENHTVKEKQRVNSTLEQILLYIDENPTMPLNITVLSQHFNLSESWIAHAFKKHLGVSPANYINRKKIFYAQSLINMGMSPVQASEICSYINYTTFYRQYKKYLGVHPAKHKKELPQQTKKST